METKAFWRSKMFWLNLLGAAVVAADWIIGHQAVLAMLHLSPEIIGVLVMIANIIRRFTSAQAPLALTNDE